MADDIATTAIPPLHRVMIVGEYWGEEEERQGIPFAGMKEKFLRALLRQVGLPLEDCYFTSAFNLRPYANRLESLCGTKAEAIEGWRGLGQGKFIHKKYRPEMDRLFEEIERERPNVILALGNLALWALCKKTGIKKYRGSPTTTFDGKWKVIPSWNPSSIFKQWELRMILLADLTKVKRESDFPELRRPVRYIYMNPSLRDIEEFYETFIIPSPFLSCDTETKNKQITEVGYSTADGSHALVIPFYSRLASDGNFWPTFAEEKKAWDWVRKINSEKPLIGQNFQYDMTYFWRSVHIPCPYFNGDTMLLHHALQPEMEKGLGFLGSIYTNEPSWKFMRTDHSTLKKEDD